MGRKYFLPIMPAQYPQHYVSGKPGLRLLIVKTAEHCSKNQNFFDRLSLIFK